MKKLGSSDGWDESKRYDYNIKGGDTVLDLGSHKGKFAREYKKKGACVIEFDIDKKCAWTYDGVLNIGGEGVSKTYLSKGKDYPCENILKYLHTEIALCKINIEGGEYELMDHILNSGLQKNVQNFQIQFHRVLEDFQQRYDRIAESLSKTHSITWGHPFLWENWQRN